MASGHRSGVLELAVLGLLHETPMHGYELRKRLNAFLGAFRAFGYGSLYPCLKELLAQGLIAEEEPGIPGSPLAGRRSKIVYRLTAEGKERLEQLLAEPGPAAWEDDGFGVRFAFFGQTRADIRLRILEGRRTRLEERLDAFRAALTRTRGRVDSYTLELHRHGLEGSPLAQRADRLRAAGGWRDGTAVPAARRQRHLRGHFRELIGRRRPRGAAGKEQEQSSWVRYE